MRDLWLSAMLRNIEWFLPRWGDFGGRPVPRIARGAGKRGTGKRALHGNHCAQIAPSHLHSRLG
jgi:hypothetical protein